MKSFEQFKKKIYLQKAFNATYWSVLGTILPFILGSIILLTFSKAYTIINFVDRGDFCLYSAGLLSSSLFLLSDNKDHTRNSLNIILYPASFLLIIISAALYCSIFIRENLFTDQNSINVSYCFVRVVSFILLGLSLIIVFKSLVSG